MPQRGIVICLYFFRWLMGWLSVVTNALLTCPSLAGSWKTKIKCRLYICDFFIFCHSESFGTSEPLLLFITLQMNYLTVTTLIEGYYFRRAGNSLICSSLISSFAQLKWVTLSDSLRLLKKNEQLWANRWGRSRQMSDREGIAQVAHDKWATVSNSLRLLIINEQFAQQFLAKKSLI